jgi:hypothetical protein
MLAFISFLAPWWLVALAPWAALVAWSLVRRGATVDVPFVQLWQTGATLSKKRGARLPPASVVLLLIAMFMAILAAVGPVVGFGSRGVVTVVVDRGVTMSLDMRFERMVHDVAATFRSRGIDADVRFVPDFRGERSGIPPTAVDTRPLLAAAVRDALDAGGSVVVVTDRRFALDGDDRVVRVAPPVAPDAVTIARVAAVASPRPQVMVTLRNRSDARTVDLTVTSGSLRRTTTVDLPARGETRDCFVDADALGTSVEASVGSGLGQQAYLARRPRRPRVEAVGPVGSSVERAIAAYGKARPPSPDASRVVIGVSADDAGPGPFVVVGRGDVGRIDVSALTVVDDPLTRDVNWAELATRVNVRGRPPTGWRPLVTAGDVLVASDASPVRRVWVGLELSHDPVPVDWVVFWTNAFDALGSSGGGDEFASSPVRSLDDGWRRVEGASPAGENGLLPGLFRHSDGRLLAVNAPDVTPDQVTGSTPDWASKVTARVTGTSGVMLAPGLSLATVACVAGAAFLATRNARPVRRPGVT